MSGEVTVPLLPCGSTDEIADFYAALGFETTYRQRKPNPYVALRREDIHLHFFEMPDFDPAQSYGSCLVMVADTGALYEAFAAGLRARYGKLLTAGVPRMTRPRRKQGNTMGFLVVDPGGNWIRIVRSGDADDGEADAEEEPASRLSRTLHNAVVLGDSKGDDAQAGRILDGALARGEDGDVVERLAALTYRAERAIRLGDGVRTDEVLAEIGSLPLEEADRVRARADLEHAAALVQTRST